MLSHTYVVSYYRKAITMRNESSNCWWGVEKDHSLSAVSFWLWCVPGFRARCCWALDAHWERPAFPSGLLWFCASTSFSDMFSALAACMQLPEKHRRAYWWDSSDYFYTLLLPFRPENFKCAKDCVLLTAERLSTQTLRFILGMSNHYSWLIMINPITGTLKGARVKSQGTALTARLCHQKRQIRIVRVLIFVSTQPHGHMI